MNKKRVELIILLLSGFKLITMVATMIFFSVQLSRVAEYTYVYQYHRTNCTPNSVKVTMFEPCKRWTPLYITEKGQTLIDNPFSLKSFRGASEELKTIDLHEERPCFCREKSQNILIDGCIIWPDCFINSQFLNYMQRDQNSRYDTNLSFVIVTAFSVFMAVGSIVFEIKLYQKNRENDYIEL